MYDKDYLKEYIDSSELRVFSDNIKVRLSKELAIKYDNNVYYNYLKRVQEQFDMLNELNIVYPGNAHPILYIYIVPDDNYQILLSFPKKFDKKTGGGRPVNCYDIDGFNKAYGTSQNKIENYPENINIAREENNIHELSHLIHSQFFDKSNILREGFAEVIPLYVLGYEDLYDEHRNMIINLKDEEILTPQELTNSEKDNSFGTTAVIPNKTCSFRHSYISSYLFVRGCFEIIENKYNLSKKEATQYFLEMIKNTNSYSEWLIYEIANYLDINKDELLNTKTIQMNAINSIKNHSNIKK